MITNPEDYKNQEWELIKNYTLTASDHASFIRYLNTVMSGGDLFYTKIVELAKSFNPKSLLDIGCAAGQQFEIFERDAPEIAYTGVDIYNEYIDVCQARQPNADFELIPSYLTLPFEDDSFDVVTLRSVLDHYFPDNDLKNGLKILDEALRVSRLGVILKFRRKPEGKTDYTIRYENQSFMTKWDEASWNSFSEGKNIESITIEGKEPVIYVVRK